MITGQRNQVIKDGETNLKVESERNFFRKDVAMHGTLEILFNYRLTRICISLKKNVCRAVTLRIFYV